jgi:iron-sulfur cluster assembly protein
MRGESGPSNGEREEMPIELTEGAAEEVKRLLHSENKTDWGVRLGVKAGGCSGLSYSMDIAETPAEKDKVHESHGVKVFVDPKSYLYLNGMELDYSREMIGGGFQFRNPNATRTCSCGTSFSA